MREFYLFGVGCQHGVPFSHGYIFLLLFFTSGLWKMARCLGDSLGWWESVQLSINRKNCPSWLLPLVSQTRGPRLELPIPWGMGEESVCTHFTLFYVSIPVRSLSSAPTMLRGLVSLLTISLSWFEGWSQNTILFGLMLLLPWPPWHRTLKSGGYLCVYIREMGGL